jgi:LuxR family maltose regulon positive regulatory protein
VSTRVMNARTAGPPAPQLDRWGLLASRLEPPLTRPTDIARGALVQRLRRSECRLVSVVAPAGYGKTTLLAQCAAEDDRPVAWLGLGEDADEPVTLARYLIAALADIAPIADDLVDELDATQPRRRAVLTRLSSGLRGADEPFSLLIDDVHLLRDRDALALIEAITREIPRGSTVTLAARYEMAFPLGKVRASGELFELGVDDLRFDADDAEKLLRGAGAIGLGADDVVALTARTEGWAVGLYLAARSWNASSSDDVVGTYGGDDRFIADYLRTTMLAGLPPDEVDFLLRSSVLDELTGPLCDAALETTGSGARLEALESSNLLVVPLDRRRERYRYHHLLRDLLRMELDHQAPELRAPIAARASVWCEDQGAPDTAIAYAIAGDDVARVATLIGRYAHTSYYGGRANAVRGWYEWFAGHAAVERYPEVAVLGTWLMVLDGRPVEAERWLAATDAAPGSLASEVEGSRSLVKALMCRDGVAVMLEDARRSLSVIGPSSAWRTAALLLEGLGLLTAGESDAAADRFRASAEESSERGTAVGGSIALALLANLAIAGNRLVEAASHLDEARRVIDDTNLHRYPTSIPAYAAAARLSLVQGDPVRARSWVDRATAIVPSLTYAMPVLAVQTSLLLARSAMGLGDAAMAGSFLADAEATVQRRPDLGSLIDDLAETRRDLSLLQASTTGLPALTPAEARLLPLLTTHLSFREIGERLFVSPHTVKTQAISIYRKLGVSSRGTAVEAARSIGLLPS